MNVYETMLLNDEAALNDVIKELVEKVIQSQDEEAKAALSTISKTISFDVSIECDANFEPHDSCLSSTAVFKSIDKFVDAEEDEEGYASVFEQQYHMQWDEGDYGDFSLDKS